MADSKLYGIEIDPITGRIAQQLYQKNSISIQPYEKTPLPDSFFDLAIGNVPFGAIPVVDKKYDKHKFRIHDYFFAKTLDKVRPGGVIAFITSSWTMDKQNPAIRKYMAQRADLLGAIRLPNNAFKANAGTEVTTDIIFLQKRDRIIDIEPDWVHLGQTEDGIPVNSYFADNPDMILGTVSNDSGVRMYGGENSVSCVPFPDADLADLLDEAIHNIHGEIAAYEHDEEELEDDGGIPADPTVRNFSYALVDGKIYYRENSMMYPREMPATAQSRVKGMIEIRDCARLLIEYQTEDYPNSDIQAERERLNTLYDAYTKKYGLLNDRANNSVFADDGSYPLLCSLEVLDEERNLKAKADMFTKRTINPVIEITHVNTASEALAVSLGERARVDLDFMADLTGFTEEKILKDLEGVVFLNIGAAYNPSKTYVTADEYLSGNVREKLALARAAQATFPDGRYDVNVRALEAVQPVDLTAPEIAVRLGATWLPPDVIEQFTYEFMGLAADDWRKKDKIKVLYSPHTKEWNVTNKSYDSDNINATNTYGTKRINAYWIIENTLNLRDVKIWDKKYDPSGKEIREINKEQTAFAQEKQDLIKEKFQEWVWSDPDRRERLCKIYNENFNSIRPRDYDGSHIKFVGMNPEIKLDEHQVNAVARKLYGGNSLFGHVVGAGKTYSMIAAAMESKRLGLSNKAMFVVPNNIVGDFAGMVMRLYPSANLLMATAKDFETKNRKKFCARIATGDYDGIVIAHSQFEKVPMSVGRQIDIIERQISDISWGIAKVKEENGQGFTVKQMEKSRKSLEAKLERLNDQSRKDNIVTFEELGVDDLFIDEADLFKNLYIVTKMRNVAGVSQTEAQKASDLFMKTQYLDELTGRRGLCFATGTPVSNTMAELYTMQRYLQYDTLVKHGLEHFDCWASTFGETVTGMELTPEGNGLQSKTRFANFYNLPELMAMFHEVADIQTKDMLNLPTPKVNYHVEVCQPSEIQKDMVAALGERADDIRNRRVSADEDNMLLITNDGRKLALDQRIINPLLPDFEGSKVNRCVNNVFDTWERTKDDSLTQLVFSDLSTPKGEKSVIEMVKAEDGMFVMDENQFFSIYDDIRRKLIAKGIPAEEIAFIHEAKNELKKQELFAKVRAGKIRVLLGSTTKMGAGTNVQDKLIALHDLDCPWRPRDLEQRLGRIERRGNLNPEVEVSRYVTEGTFDAYLYQMIENKQRFISQVITSKSPARVMQEIDEIVFNYAEIKALATGDPRIMEHCNLSAEVSKLKMLKSHHLSQRYELEDRIIKKYPAEIATLNEVIAGYTADAATVAANTPADKDDFTMTVRGEVCHEKKRAGTALLEACKTMTSPDPVPLGTYRGFEMELSYYTGTQEFALSLKGSLHHRVFLGQDIHGNITRIDNKLDGMADNLTRTEGELKTVMTQMETAREQSTLPFSREQELTEKSERLAKLTTELKLTEKDREILNEAPDEGEVAATERKTRKREDGAR
jgi:N12 class adenine-specific DNA methylase